MSRLKSPQSRSGFTLAEILLAMMVFAIAITTILALLARSIETADSIIVKDEAISLSSAVDSYMSGLPFYDLTDPLNAYSSVQDSGRRLLYTYQYRAIPNTDRGDGTPEVFTGDMSDSVVGTDYIIVSGVRDPSVPIQRGYLATDIGAIESRFFLVSLEVSPANPFNGTLDPNPNAAGGSDGFPVYDSAVLVIFAEFYSVSPTTETDKNDLIDVNNTPSNPDDDLTPVFSFNFAVRR